MNFFPEQTIRYKTYAKQTLVDGLNKMFLNHPDALLQRTKASIEFPKTEADYPAVVVRFYERTIFNAGVGHKETSSFAGESDSIEVSASISGVGGIQISWPAISGAASYTVYRGLTSGGEDQAFNVTSPNFTDTGASGLLAAPPTIVTATLDTPQPQTVASPTGGLSPGTYYYRVVAIEPTQAVIFQHYFYTADIEFAVYALSAYDRDLVADSLVQTVAMGTLETYTNNFFERIYPTNELYPDSQLHFININADQIAGFGESQAQTPWGAEDDLMYSTSYRVGVFGELYSLPPKLTYAMVQKVILYPYITGLQSPPQNPPGDDAAWVSNYPA